HLERTAPIESHACWDELPAARRARRDSVALLQRVASRRSVSAWPPVGFPPCRTTRAVQSCRILAARRYPYPRIPHPPHHRPPLGFFQHWRADGKVHLASPARGGPGTFS